MITVNININIKGKKYIQSGLSIQKGGPGYDGSMDIKVLMSIVCNAKTFQ